MSLRIFPEPIGDTARFRHDPVRFIRLDSCGAAANPHRKGARYLCGALFLFTPTPEPAYAQLTWEATAYPIGGTWHWDAIAIRGATPWSHAYAAGMLAELAHGDYHALAPSAQAAFFLLEQLILLAARNESAITADMAPAPFTPTPPE